VVLGRCRITDSAPAPTTDAAHRAKPDIGVDVAAAGGSIAPSAPANISEPRQRNAPDQVMGRCGPAPTTDAAHRAKPGIGIDVAAAGGAIAPSAP
jgi:hypothetical protein